MTATTKPMAAQAQAVNRSHIAIADIATLSMTTLDWLEAILHAIEHLNIESPESVHIKSLASAGQYLAMDQANAIDCVREQSIHGGEHGD